MALRMGLDAASAGVVELAEVERRALVESPTLAAARARAEEQRARVGAAGVLADPSLGFEIWNALPTNGSRDAELWLTVTQPLPAPGKRGARRASSAVAAELAGEELAALERRFLGDLRLAWAELWFAQRERQLLNESHEVEDLLLSVAEARFGGGREPLGAPLAARLTLRRHELRQQSVDARWLALQARVVELAGLRDGLALPRVGALPELTLPDLEIAAVTESNPGVRVALRRLELAEANLAATRLDLRPDWSVGSGVIAPENEDPDVLLTVGVELPLFRRRRVGPLIVAAEHARNAARADFDAARIAARGELTRLYIERARIDLQLIHVRQGLLPETNAAFEAARAALVGESGTVAAAAELLEAWVEAQIDLARLESERFANRAALVAQLPRDPIPGGVE